MERCGHADTRGLELTGFLRCQLLGRHVTVMIENKEELAARGLEHVA